MSVKNVLDNFYLFHQKKGNELARDKNFLDAFLHYRHSLDLNPFNLFLISKITEQIIEDPRAAVFFPLLSDGLKDALKNRGEISSVYDIASSISYVSQKIMRAHNAIQPLVFPSIYEIGGISKTPRLVLLTCVWQRPALTEVILSYYQAVAKKLMGQIELILLAVGSEGKNSRKLCEKYGFHYLEHDNLPLSDKWEFGLKNTQAFKPDAVIIVGSDDLLSVSLFQKYAQFLDEGYLFCGLSDGYFLDFSNDGEMLYWKGYGGLNSERGMPWRLNETLGMGRMYSRLLLEKIDYSLWQGRNVNKGLDGFAKERLFAFGMLAVLKEHALSISVNGKNILFGQVAMKMKDLEAVAIDIKSPGANVTDMSGYKKSEEAFMIIDESWEFLNKHFPKDTVDSLKDLLN